MGCGALLLTTSLLPVQHPPKMPIPIEEPDPMDLPAPLRVVRAFLDLSQEQLDQYIAHRQETEESTSGVRHELAEAERALHEVLEMEEPEPAEVGGLVIRIHSLRKTIGEAHASLAEGFVSRLDEEQLHKLQLLRTMAVASRVMPAFQELGLVPREGRH